MKVFISWSGAKSLAVAEVLREELPCLINELETFVSAEDIEKGTAWFPKIATELDQSNFAIICLTPENLQSRWLHFEAGVLAGKFSQTKVAPLLIELENIAQVPPPLSELQLTKFAKQDFLKLLFALNKNTAKPVSDAVLKTTFERSWEPLNKKIEEKLGALKSSKVNIPVRKRRTQEEILDEVLTITRSIASELSQRVDGSKVIFGNQIVPRRRENLEANREVVSTEDGKNVFKQMREAINAAR